MALEIERKFLVNDESWRKNVLDHRPIRQGYLAEAGRASVRVRLDGEAANLNIKAAKIGTTRSEFEYPVPVADAQTLLAELCVYPPVEKTRYRVEYAGHLWEIDEFVGANAGLVVAEVELDSADECFEHPPWLGAEVTDQAAYYNHALAAHPYRDWAGRD